MLASLFLAAAASAVSSEVSQNAFTGQMVMGLIAIVSCICAVIAARRQPPIAEQMHKEFATKEELEVVRTEAAADVRRIYDHIKEMTDSSQRFFTESERGRGNMLAKMEMMEKDLRELRGEIHEWMARSRR